MNDKNNKIISAIRSRIADLGKGDESSPHFGDQQVALLLGELQIAQLELEMQNDELATSANMLEVERSKFANFFNLAPVCYFILDDFGCVIEVNQIASSLLSISKEKMIHQRFQSFISDDHWEKFYVFLLQVKSEGEKQSTEVKLVVVDGKERYAKMEAIAFFDGFNKKLQYYVTLTDITQIKLVEQNLRETTRRLEMTLTASGTGTWTIHPKNNLLFLDDFSLSLLEIKPREFDGNVEKIMEFVHPHDRQSFSKRLHQGGIGENKIDFEFRIVTNEKEIKYLALQGHLINSGQEEPYFAGVMVDVTPRKLMEKVTLDLQSEKQKLILATTFTAQEKERQKISSALHDSICQLLYGIRLNLQNIQLNNQLQTEFRNVDELLDQVIKETRDLSYELTPSVLRDFGFAPGIKEMSERLSTAGFKINTQIKQSTAAFHTDLQLSVFRIIQELLNNCIKHANALTADVLVEIDQEWITIIVSDNGKGFDLDVERALVNGSGLRGIKSRVFLLNGKIDIITSKRGSKVEIIFRNDSGLIL